MIAHLSRLLELWRIVAHYRLDLLVDQHKLPPKARYLIRLIRLHPAARIKTEKHNPLKLKCALEDMGVLAIKMGQLLSTRRDLIPPEILNQLVLLQDNVKPFDVDIAKQRISQSFKAELSSLFAQFDDEPLAAASIAQVHTATLHNGQQVVVKVTRPEIRAQIIQDFEILQWLAKFLEQRLEVARALHLTEIIQDYRSTILNELDLTIEADNARRMRQYFLDSEMIYVPEVYMDSPDAMVAERITGVPISEVEQITHFTVNRKQLAENGLTVFFTQVFRDNFFHADMHPGNVFIDTSGKYSARYIALDCAIMGELSRADQMTVARMLLAVMNSDFNQLIQVVHQAGWIRPNTDKDALAREMRRTVSPMIAKSMDQLDFAGILLKIMDIARRFQLEIPPQLTLLLKTLVHVEGLGRDLYPQLDIWSLAKPIIADWIKQQASPSKHLKQLKQQIPDLLLGMPDASKLLIDTVNVLQHQAHWQDRQQRELQALKLQIQMQQRRSWIFASLMAICLTLAVITPWYVAIWFILFASLFAIWRMMK